MPQPISVPLAHPEDLGLGSDELQLWGHDARNVIRKAGLQFAPVDPINATHDDYFSTHHRKQTFRFALTSDHQGQEVEFLVGGKPTYRAKFKTAYQLHRQGLLSDSQRAEGREGLLIHWERDSVERVL